VQERSLCRQLSHIIQILYTLANVAIKPGTTTEFMFNNLRTLYNVLGNLTKYFYGKSSKQNAAFQSVKYKNCLHSIYYKINLLAVFIYFSVQIFLCNFRFIQVIQLAGKPLKSAFYNLLL